PSDHPQALRARVQRHVIGHEAPCGGQPLYHRVTRVVEHQLVAVVDLRPTVVVAVRELSQARGDVPTRYPRGEILNPPSGGAGLRDQRLNQIQLTFAVLVLSARDSLRELV